MKSPMRIRHLSVYSASPPLSRERAIFAFPSPALGHHPLGVRNRTRRIEPLRAGLGAIHDGVAAIEAKRILEPVEALAGALIAAVDQPAVRLQQDRGAQVAVRVPPVARTRRRAAEAKNALPRTVELCTLLG